MDGDKRKQLESILENMKKENEQSQAPPPQSPPRTPPPQHVPPPERGGSGGANWGSDNSPYKQRRNSGSEGPGSAFVCFVFFIKRNLF